MTYTKYNDYVTIYIYPNGTKMIIRLYHIRQMKIKPTVDAKY